MRKEIKGKEIKNTILAILVEFAEYCEKHGLRYYLCYGTLLGAIRHKGFIPWDDDIDVSMPRPDYLKLHELVKAEPISEKYKLVSSLTGESIYPFAKIIDLSTEVVSLDNTEETNLWIDIFPLDGVPDGDEGAKHLELAYNLRYHLMLSIQKLGTGKTRTKAFLKLPLVIGAKIIGKNRWLERIETNSLKYGFDECDLIAAVSFSLGKREINIKSEYIQPEKVEFEGYEFNAPSCWKKYVSQMYGDYMQLPPENKRYTHKIKAYICE